jgi:hypothetical protein
MRRRFELALEFGSRKAQRLDHPEPFGVAGRAPLLRRTLALQFFHTLLNA